MSDQVTRLTEAAAAGIADVAPMIEHDIRRVRAVQLELTLANAAQVVECTAGIERRARVRRD